MTPDKNGFLPIHSAAKSGNRSACHLPLAFAFSPERFLCVDIVGYFVNQGCPIDIPSRVWTTPLHIAVKSKSHKVICYLQEANVRGFFLSCKKYFDPVFFLGACLLNRVFFRQAGSCPRKTTCCLWISWTTKKKKELLICFVNSFVFPSLP
jgi:hypothetical protein